MQFLALQYTTVDWSSGYYQWPLKCVDRLVKSFSCVQEAPPVISAVTSAPNECGCLNSGICRLITRRGRVYKRCNCPTGYRGSKCQLTCKYFILWFWHRLFIHILQTDGKTPKERCANLIWYNYVIIGRYRSLLATVDSSIRNEHLWYGIINYMYISIIMYWILCRILCRNSNWLETIIIAFIIN